MEEIALFIVTIEAEASLNDMNTPALDVSEYGLETTLNEQTGEGSLSAIWISLYALLLDTKPGLLF